jgi:hypothetical protein
LILHPLRGEFPEALFRRTNTQVHLRIYRMATCIGCEQTVRGFSVCAGT